MASRSICVLGGINLDILLTAREGKIAPATSNPARAVLSPGGVGRNIAESLARWGAAVTLLGAVGDDPLSAKVSADTAAAGVDVGRVLHVHRAVCGLYAALLDADGGLATAASAMDVVEHVDGGYIASCRDAISESSLLVVDANIGVDAIERAVSIAEAAGVRVVAEPVSVAKATRLAAARCRVFAVTPNEDEYPPLCSPGAALTTDWTIVTRGAAGVTVAGPDRVSPVEIPADPVPPVDVTGAGDALVAGLAFALSRGESFGTAVRFGMATARETVLHAGSAADTIHPAEAAALLSTCRRADVESTKGQAPR